MVLTAAVACSPAADPPRFARSDGGIGVRLEAPRSGEAWPSASVAMGSARLELSPHDMSGWGQPQSFDPAPRESLPVVARPSTPIVVRGDAEFVLGSASPLRRPFGQGRPRPLELNPRADDTHGLLGGSAELPARPGRYKVTFVATWPDGEAVFSFLVDIA